MLLYWVCLTFGLILVASFIYSCRDGIGPMTGELRRDYEKWLREAETKDQDWLT